MMIILFFLLCYIKAVTAPPKVAFFDPGAHSEFIILKDDLTKGHDKSYTVNVDHEATRLFGNVLVEPVERPYGDSVRGSEYSEGGLLEYEGELYGSREQLEGTVQFRGDPKTFSRSTTFNENDLLLQKFGARGSAEGSLKYQSVHTDRTPYYTEGKSTVGGEGFPPQFAGKAVAKDATQVKGDLQFKAKGDLRTTYSFAGDLSGAKYREGPFNAFPGSEIKVENVDKKGVTEFSASADIDRGFNDYLRYTGQVLERLPDNNVYLGRFKGDGKSGFDTQNQLDDSYSIEGRSKGQFEAIFTPGQVLTPAQKVGQVRTIGVGDYKVDSNTRYNDGGYGGGYRSDVEATEYYRDDVDQEVTTRSRIRTRGDVEFDVVDPFEVARLDDSIDKAVTAVYVDEEDLGKGDSYRLVSRSQVNDDGDVKQYRLVKVVRNGKVVAERLVEDKQFKGATPSDRYEVYEAYREKRHDPAYTQKGLKDHIYKIDEAPHQGKSVGKLRGYRYPKKEPKLYEPKNYPKYHDRSKGYDRPAHEKNKGYYDRPTHEKNKGYDRGYDRSKPYEKREKNYQFKKPPHNKKY